MVRISDFLGDVALSRGEPSPVVVTPRPVEGLVSRRVLVMDFLEGVPLSRSLEEAKRRGIDPNGPEAQLFGRKLLRGLTDAFGLSILGDGFFHADPHPGNIFVLDNGDIGLIDFGQVKGVSDDSRTTLAKVMVALAERESDTRPEDLKKIGDLSIELGVNFKENALQEAPAATAMWLFDGSVKELPGGYDMGDLSPDSPLKDLKSFPQDLVLVGRNTVLIKGIAARLGVEWSLAKEWAPIAREVLAGRPLAQPSAGSEAPPLGKRRRLLRAAGSVAFKAAEWIPAPVRRRAASGALRVEDWRARRRERKAQRRD